jgi:hypothetical protein
MEEFRGRVCGCMILAACSTNRIASAVRKHLFTQLSSFSFPADTSGHLTLKLRP